MFEFILYWHLLLGLGSPLSVVCTPSEIPLNGNGNSCLLPRVSTGTLSGVNLSSPLLMQSQSEFVCVSILIYL